MSDEGVSGPSTSSGFGYSQTIPALIYPDPGSVRRHRPLIVVAACVHNDEELEPYDYEGE